MAQQRFTGRILIDLGGVLNEYKGDFDENNIPKIKTGARNFIKKLSKLFPECELYLYTSRNSLLASKWLVKYKLDKYFKDVTNIKLPAMLTIEDRAVCFTGDFEKLYKDVKNFKV